jgi:hypothetical protein
VAIVGLGAECGNSGHESGGALLIETVRDLVHVGSRIDPALRRRKIQFMKYFDSVFGGRRG